MCIFRYASAEPSTVTLRLYNWPQTRGRVHRADVYVAPGSTFSSVTVLDCDLHGGITAQWSTVRPGGRWNVTYSAITRCLTMTFTATSLPSLLDLAATPFGIELAPPHATPTPECDDDSGTARDQDPSEHGVHDCDGRGSADERDGSDHADLATIVESWVGRFFNR